MGKRISICLIFLFGIFLLIGFSQAQCVLGKFGGSCQYNCSENCYHGAECTTNSGNCGCDITTGSCFSCTRDYLGDFCNLKCGENCSLSDQCLQSGLGCGCDKQYGYCNSCPKTLWGDYCERPCSKQCINSECERSVGVCTLGCTKGFYGISCTLVCPSSCLYGCDQSTAECFPSYCANCLGGLPNCDRSRQKCTKGCVDGFYGDSCDKTCAVVTNITLCTKCTNLITIGITVCDECQSRYYIDPIAKDCKLCSTGCKDNSTTIAKCFPNSGECRFGCTPGWSGLKCDSFSCAVPDCESCASNQPIVCASCKSGFYLSAQQCVKCGDNCATSNVCDKVSGTCTNGCKIGWYGNKCTDNCKTNCQQGECSSDGVCTKGCNGKRYGLKCDYLCSNCLTTCNRNSGLCDSTCIDGFYGTDCKLQCNTNCLNNKCNQTDGKCSSGCKTGYYGDTCQLKCGTGCAGNVCTFTTGSCSGGCVDGKYGDYCDMDCQMNCSPRLCLQNGGACTSTCKVGFYGDHCLNPCPSSCPSECAKNNGTCVGSCPNGKYGSRCEFPCSMNCNKTSCDKVSGICVDGCKAGYYGGTCFEPCSKCDSSGCTQSSGECIGKCINSFYGVKCELACSIGCLSSLCDKTTGSCSVCKDGFYGDKCDITCNDNCKFLRCNKTSGYCSEGCVPGQFGIACDKNCNDCTSCNQNTGTCNGCVVGKFGSNCEKNCSLNCALATSGNLFCDGVDGYCLTGCNNGWYGSACSIPCNNDIHCIGTACERLSGECSGNCVTGWYGSKCNQKCSANCVGNICHRTSGDCTLNCTSGFYGTACSLPCLSTCTECERLSGTCTLCKPGYFGQNCASSCSSHCLYSGVPATKAVCDKNTGICISGCKDGWYTQTCINQCSPNCNGDKCNVETGKCENGCKNDKYGAYCENLCTYCAGTGTGNCNIITGECLQGCEVGYVGSACTQTCLPGCKNKTCSYSMNNCSLGCQDGLYGTTCNNTCDTNCAKNICDRNNGSCIEGCNPGWFGEKCKYACPVKCAGSVCDRVAGTCIDVCTGSECTGKTIKDETNVDLAIIIGASIGGAVVLLIIIIIICCHCIRKSGRRKGGSEDILTRRSDSLNGIDNRQFDHFDEIKKDDWVLRNTRYEAPKQNGDILVTRIGAEANIDFYDFPSQPSVVYATDQNHMQFTHEDLPPPPPEAHFNFDFDGRDGVQVEMLPQYVEYMLNKEKAFENEYKGLPEGLKHPYDVAIKPGNKRKNRYKNIYAYDHSRVVLRPELDTSQNENSSTVQQDNSDYINASYFDGYHEPKAYIACQGPTDEMVNDFWRMVWQLRIQTIAMLTNIVEVGQIKCKKYWPDENKTEKFGNIYVGFDYQEVFADFTLTNLVVTNSIFHDTARLQVKHFQFTSWPDKDIPKYVTPLIEYYCKVKSMHREGPLLVHCSAGVGRSGTFIGLDYLMDQADSEGRVNIYKCVEKMRIARPNMVQTPDQYIFLHQALTEALLTSESPIDEDEFENYFNQMQVKDPRTGSTRLQHEFSQLKSQNVKHMFEAATMEENKHRNRHKDILASDECRVFLWSRIKGCTDYINAIYLPSFRNKYCFIATEMPQCSTIVDFCRMIFQEEVRTIVMLDNETSGINVNDHYWPNPKQTMDCGPFSITITEVKEYEDYTLRSLNFKFCVDDQKGTYKVNQFHYKCWSEGKVTPVSVDSFLNFVRAVTDWQSDSVKHPIIVHCLDGATKVGLFCLVRACLDRLQSDGDVSVVHTLHHMRARRQQIVPNYEQYKFCHDCILRQISED